MKIWAFYLKASKEDMSIINAVSGDKFKHQPCALTTSKKLAKLFRLTRNMDKYIERTYDEESDDVDSVEKSFGGKRLDINYGPYFIDKNTENQKEVMVGFLSTTDECGFTEDMVDSYNVLGALMSDAFPVDIFDEKLKNHLCYLAYDQFTNFFIADRASQNGEYEVFDLVGSIEIRFRLDFFAVFCKLYGDRLSDSFMSHIIIKEEI